jgi:nucleoside-diphosphate-sugar epimerase
VVTGAGGFLGSHLVELLLARGFHHVRAVDALPFPSWSARDPRAECVRLDLREAESARAALRGATDVFQLAWIDEGGGRRAANVLVQTNLLGAAVELGVARFSFASSADARDPSARGAWEKLLCERLCRVFAGELGLATHVARLHSVYGPRAPKRGARAEDPTSLCRRVFAAIEAEQPVLELRGGGHRTDNYTWLDDALEALVAVHESAAREPVEVGSRELVSVNRLVSTIEEVARIRLERRYRLDEPDEPNGRASDNALLRALSGREPTTALRAGIERTYRALPAEIGPALRDREVRTRPPGPSAPSNPRVRGR